MRGGWYRVTGDSGKALASRLGLPIEPAKGPFYTSGREEPASWRFGGEDSYVQAMTRQTA